MDGMLFSHERYGVKTIPICEMHKLNRQRLGQIYRRLEIVRDLRGDIKILNRDGLVEVYIGDMPVRLFRDKNGTVVLSYNAALNGNVADKIRNAFRKKTRSGEVNGQEP